jgi:hypothetical protein
VKVKYIDTIEVSSYNLINFIIYTFFSIILFKLSKYKLSNIM